MENIITTNDQEFLDSHNQRLEAVLEDMARSVEQLAEMRATVEEIRNRILGQPGEGEKFEPAGPAAKYGPFGGFLSNNPHDDLYVGVDFAIGTRRCVLADEIEPMLTDPTTLVVPIRNDTTETGVEHLLINRRASVEVLSPF